VSVADAVDGLNRPPPQLGRRALPVAFTTGAVIGVLGGLIGLGGAEFRLPVLISLFGFVALQAVILNKAMSLIVVLTAVPARLMSIPYNDIAAHWSIIVNLLAGSVIGAWWGATWAIGMRSATLYRVLAALLVVIAATLILTHFGHIGSLGFGGAKYLVGVGAGAVIGTIAALMGVAGGELLIPTIVLLYAVDIKIAGSLSLAISVPTMLVAFTRYSRDKSFKVMRANAAFVVTMAAGSIAGTVVGGLLLGLVSSLVLVPFLATLLVVSAIRVWTHAQTSVPA
jgi:uncharacterized protein